jgi:hypothetical protein
MEDIKLKSSEKATLLVLYKVCDASLEAHPPIEAITSKFKKHERHVPKKAIKALCRLGLAKPHPTGGGMTYNLTRSGKEYVETYMGEYLQKF